MLTAAALWALWSRAAGVVRVVTGFGTGAKDALGRFWNGNAAVAVIVSGLVVAVLVAVIWLRHEAATTATAGRDAVWGERLSNARLAAWQAWQLRNRKALDTTEAERARQLAEERDAAVDRAAALEAALARLTDDPIAFRAAVTKELRK